MTLKITAPIEKMHKLTDWHMTNTAEEQILFTFYYQPLIEFIRNKFSWITDR